MRILLFVYNYGSNIYRFRDGPIPTTVKRGGVDFGRSKLRPERKKHHRR